MSRENVKDEAYLTIGLPHPGFKPRTLKVNSALLDLEFGANVIHGEIWFQGVQAIRVSDAFAHPCQFLSVRAVRYKSSMGDKRNMPADP